MQYTCTVIPFSLPEEPELEEDQGATENCYYMALQDYNRLLQL